MSEDHTYNGWKNYETWCVSLWLDNDEGLYHGVRNLAAECVDKHEPYVDEVRWNLAEQLKEMVGELAEMTCPGCRSGASFVSDLLGAALDEVDWHEIARSLLVEIVETRS